MPLPESSGISSLAWLLVPAALVGMLFLSALFSASEAALFSLTSAQRLKLDSARRSDRAIERFAFTDMHSSVQSGNQHYVFRVRQCLIELTYRIRGGSVFIRVCDRNQCHSLRRAFAEKCWGTLSSQNQQVYCNTDAWHHAGRTAIRKGHACHQ